MPISSTNHRLTHEIYKPPPKSLEYVRREDWESHNSSRNHSREGSPSSFLKREKHLGGLSGKRTAVVGPVNENSTGILNGASNGKGGLGKAGAASSKGASSTSTGAVFARTFLGGFCCRCHGLCCMRCYLFLFLLGLLLGALITGLVLGLVLDARQQQAAQAAATANNNGCFQSPCSAGSTASCAYLKNDTEINCECSPLVGDPVSTAGISVGGYICTFYNITATTAIMTTAP